jgi:hypothetical protein
MVLLLRILPILGALLVACKTNGPMPGDADNVDSGPTPLPVNQFWFAPLPPLKNHPFVGSTDFINLFSVSAPWSNAAEYVQVFKLYGEWVAYNASDAELEQVVNDLEARGIALAVEEGPLTRTASCGKGVESFCGKGRGPERRQSDQKGGRKPPSGRS